MSPRSLLALIAVTAVCVVAAVLGVTRYYGAVQTKSVEAPVFPELEERANEVSEIAVRDDDSDFTIKRDGEVWVVADKQDYPARVERVREAVFQLSQLRLSEPKTKLAELYPRIEVEDLDSEDAKSKWVQIKNTEGEVLAELIVGKQRFNVARPGGSGVYIRRPGEEQAWLAKGALDIATDDVDWLAKDIIDLPAERVQRVTTTDADGAVLVISRENPDQEDFEVSGVPEGEELKEEVDTTLKDMAAALAELRLNDVAPAADFNFEGEGSLRAEVVSFGGWVVDVAMIEKDEDTWARFELTKASPGTATATDAGAPEDALSQAAERVEGWAYKVPDFKIKHLKTRMADLLKGEEGEDKSS